MCGDRQALLAGSIQQVLLGYFHAAGYAYRRQAENATGADERGVFRGILMDGDDRYPTKSFGVLTGVVRPDFALWIEALAKGDGSLVQLAGAPLPGTNLGGGGVGAKQMARFGAPGPEEEQPAAEGADKNPQGREGARDF